MAVSLNSIKRGTVLRPTIDLLYASHGIGKTSYGAGSPNPIFLQTEDGLGKIDAATFGILTSFDDVLAAIAELYTKPHDFQTVVLDSVGWLEPLIWDRVCQAQNPVWANIESPGYGKGYAAAKPYWRYVLDGLSGLRNDRGMGVILLGHSETKTVEHPELPDYDRFQPKLHKDATAMLQEYVDDVYFMSYHVSVTKSDSADKNSRAIGVGGSARFIHTTERPSHLAKNRWGMPDKISLPNDPGKLFWTVAQHIPYYQELSKRPAQNPAMQAQAEMAVNENENEEKESQAAE